MFSSSAQHLYKLLALSIRFSGVDYSVFSAHVSEVVPKWQEMVLRGLARHAVGCRDPVQLVVEAPAKSRSEHERRHRHGVPTPGYRSFHELSNWRATFSRVSAAVRVVVGNCTELL